MQVAVLFTGGKDSSLALYRSLQGGCEIVCLVSMIPRRENSWMFHYPNMHLIDLYSDATGFPILKSETSGVKEEEVEDLKHVLEGLSVDAVVSGAVASRYQKERIDKICGQIGLKSIAPLWQEDPVNLLKEMLRLRFEVVVCGVYAHGFDQSWLGKQISNETLQKLLELNERYGISVAGEGGEYETLTLDAPFFRKRIQIVKAETLWRKSSGIFVVKDAKLVEKQE